jgi:hypothetical protein
MIVGMQGVLAKELVRLAWKFEDLRFEREMGGRNGRIAETNGR